MEIPFLSLQPQHDAIEQELQQTIQRVLKSNWFILGKELSSFENAFAAYCGTKFSAGCANGLDALVISLRALGIGSGDEVIVPSNTFIATWLAVTAVGAKVVPVEPDSNTYNIDPLKIENAITSRTKVIIPVHLFGQACEMERIMRIAEKYNLYVVEDNAQAQGATCGGKKTGSFGNCNATSFYPGKNLGAMGDGGAITTNSEEINNRILRLRNYGSTEKYYHDEQGVNSRLDELQAAILSVKLKKLDNWTAQRQALALDYLERLKGIDDLILPQTAKDCSHVYHLFVVRTNKRNELQQYLADAGIQTIIHYPIPPHLQKAFSNVGLKSGDFPIAEQLANTSLSLPIWPGMTQENMDHVCSEIIAFYKTSN